MPEQRNREIPNISASTFCNNPTIMCVSCANLEDMLSKFVARCCPGPDIFRDSLVNYLEIFTFTNDILYGRKLQAMKFVDYYAVMGLTETASVDEIKKTYRRLARKYHPDVSKEKQAEEKFKEIGEAYAVLGDQQKKSEYDELRNYRESDSDFAIPPEWQHRESDAGFYHKGQEGFSDFFESVFRQSRSHGQHDPVSLNGDDIKYVLPITLEESFRGGARTISYNVVTYNSNGTAVQQETTLKVIIPKGVIPGQQLRLGAKGHPGFGTGTSGDLYLEIEFLPHEKFTVDGRDLIQFLPVAPWEIALGGVVEVTTVNGNVKLTIPKNSKPGQKLRVKGRGLMAQPPGDLYIVLQVYFPDVENEDQRRAYEALEKQFNFNSRKTKGAVK